MRWWGWMGGAMVVASALAGLYMALSRRKATPAEVDEIAGLGTLSQKSETGTEDGAAAASVVSTGVGDAGGISYGAYQFATNTGSAAAFVKWLSKNFPAYAEPLQGLEPGNSDFSDAWRMVAARDGKGFFEAQHRYVGERFYLPAREGLMEVLGLDVRQRSRVLRDVLWSTAVQHGPDGAVRLWKAALGGGNPNALDDAALIRAVYQESERRDGTGDLVYLRTSSEEVQEGVARRYEREMTTALGRLQTERLLA